MGLMTAYSNDMSYADVPAFIEEQLDFLTHF
jgi:hypothetical protein